MILATHNGLQVAYLGRIRSGPLYVITDGTKALHAGCRLYVTHKWKKLTGLDI